MWFTNRRGVDSRDKVKHIETSDELFVVRMMLIDEI